MTKKHIALVCGGDSSEYEVSLKSAENIYKCIDQERYSPWMIRMRFTDWVVINDDNVLATVDKSNFSFTINGEKIKPEFAIIMIHGTPGEDGVLQGYFDLQKIPYSASGVYASALTFHKFYCDNFLRAFDIKMAKSMYFRKEDKIVPDRIVEALGLPLFVKPSAGGSSFGVTKVKSKDQILDAVEAAFNESGDCLCEEFIDGLELAVGACEIDHEILPFLPTEVIPGGEFFDFNSKYTIGGATEITPARIPALQIEQCQKLAVKIYKLTGCKGIARIDFILKENEFFFLEINTIPGMTETSFIPQQLDAMGLRLSDIISKIIETGLHK
ncbi:MAG: D-alanine--D-alanine ligase [Prolixibacteraceae bacterium]|nr:D-alanine--D-alanine ligase [Prolixibacteraceae bacterium]MBN2650687.1 D-alanine--D-alanine ligase [Prolixibacteraceae bacterium]